jgi:rifampicin phosphotransferase
VRLSAFRARTDGPPGSGDPPWRVFARLVDTREQDDWVFARLLRVLREACLAWGRAAADAGWVREPGDAFLLTLAELTSGLPPAPGLLERRTALVLAQESLLPPDRVVDGIPEHDEGPGPSWEGELTGQGAVPGQAEGVAGSLPGPGEAAAGRIAVVRALTPQDIVFLPGIAGLVVARPGTCGHAVLIARELGIPTVTWADRCVERIPTGARVRVDGTTGRVRWHQDY